MIRTYRWSLSVAVAIVAVATVPVACGPSVQLIYEGNIRFEHCYRLDFDAQIAPTHRRACWSEWLERYAQGQTRDRVDYGRRRMEAIDRGEGATLALRLEGASDAGPPAVRAEAVPVPTSLHSPPPALIPVAVPSSPADTGAAGAPPLQSAEPDPIAVPPTKIKRPQGSGSDRGRGKKTKS